MFRDQPNLTEADLVGYEFFFNKSLMLYLLV